MFKFYAAMLNVIFDLVFAIILVNNLVIFVWRIIWDTQDLYLKDSSYLNSLISLLISYVLLFIVKFMQIREINAKFNRSIARLNSQNNNHQQKQELQEQQEQSKANKPIKICKRFNLKFFILIFSIANINHWRAVWNFTIKLTDNSSTGALTIGAISVLSLIGMKRICALMSVPFQINKDCYQNAYQIQPTSAHHNYYISLKNKYSAKIAPSSWQIFLSFMFEYLADFFTIQAWRSLWHTMDTYLFESDPMVSGFASLTIGSVIYLIISIVNKPLNRLLSNSEVKKKARSNKINLAEASDNKVGLLTSLNVMNLNESKVSTVLVMSPDTTREMNNDSRFSKKLLLDAAFYLVFIGTVSVWRGIWMLQTEFCYPQMFDDSFYLKNILNFIYFVLSIMILWSVNLTSALLSRSSCEDSYFELKKNYILKANHFDSYFSSKKGKCASALQSEMHWKDFIEHKLFCCKKENKEAHLASSLYVCKTQNNVSIKIPHI